MSSFDMPKLLAVAAAPLRKRSALQTSVTNPKIRETTASHI
jgi:hypothetical protein